MFCALANYASNKLNKLDEFNKENVWRLVEMLDKLCPSSVHYLNGNIDFQNCFETTKIDKISHDFNYDKKEEIKEMCDKVEKGELVVSNEGKIHIIRDLMKPLCPAFKPSFPENIITKTKDKFHYNFRIGEVGLSDMNPSVEAALGKFKSCGINCVEKRDGTRNRQELLAKDSELDKIIRNLQRVSEGKEPQQEGMLSALFRRSMTHL